MLAPFGAPGAVVDGRYRIEEIVARGGAGTVFRATQLNLDRPVALKLLHEGASDAAALARFQREAQLLQRLEHPNIVRLLDFGSAEGGAPFLVFEYLRGATLDRVLTATGPMPPARVAHVAAQILKALMEAHAAGVGHRDLKPQNVFLSTYQGETDFVKVLDFGIAKAGASGGITERGAVVGTPAYMAPEQIMGEAATPASDLYALGLLMAEALTGVPVHGGLSVAEIAARQIAPDPVPHAPAVLGSPLARVIQRATEKDPARRYVSASAMLADLPSAQSIALGTAPAPGYAAPSGITHVPASALVPASSVLTHAPVALPHVPPPPPRGRPKASGPPWLLFGVLGGGAAMIAAALFVVFAFVRVSDEPASRSPQPPTNGSPRSAAGGHLALSQITTDTLIERVEAAGYKVSNNSETKSQGSTISTVSFLRDNRGGYALLYRFDSVQAAKSTEGAMSQSDDDAVLREDRMVLVVKVANGAERGNAASRRLLAAIVR
jgi:hypothetical protein